jgi:4-hydroxybenzoate polyprenyltransferase
LRTLLVLGRVSNLPTVWSDCLAAWWLGGGGNPLTLACISLSASFFYLGGMFLNDAFDATFDSFHRRNRPIPSGAASRREVWRWGFAWLALGLAGAAALGAPAALWAAVLCGCILFYNAVHKWAPLAPILMGACRWCVYLLAAAAARRGVDGEVIWKGLGLAAYIAGLSWLARKETGRGPVNYLPATLLAAPILFALLIDDDSASLEAATVYSLVLTGWSAWALSRSAGKTEPNVGYTVSRLLAGIVLVDLLAVAGTEPWIGYFAVWFVLALLLQRFVPAT